MIFLATLSNHASATSAPDPKEIRRVCDMSFDFSDYRNICYRTLRSTELASVCGRIYDSNFQHAEKMRCLNSPVSLREILPCVTGSGIDGPQRDHCFRTRMASDLQETKSIDLDPHMISGPSTQKSGYAPIARELDLSDTTRKGSTAQ